VSLHLRLQPDLFLTVARIEKAAGDLQRPPGSKLLTSKMAPSAPVFEDLHWQAKGANQNCCSIKGTKLLLRRRHKTAARRAMPEGGP
jgi:hypothetical protein